MPLCLLNQTRTQGLKPDQLQIPLKAARRHPLSYFRSTMHQRLENELEQFQLHGVAALVSPPRNNNSTSSGPDKRCSVFPGFGLHGLVRTTLGHPTTHHSTSGGSYPEISSHPGTRPSSLHKLFALCSTGVSDNILDITAMRIRSILRSL